jgi:outer membrane exchange protein TraA
MLLRRLCPALAYRLRLAQIALAGAFALAAALTSGSASAAPVIIPTSTADALQGAGQGLCVVNAITMQPAIDFPQMAGVFNSGINAFIDANKANWNQYVQRTIFDLSNNQDTGPKISWGDYINSMSPQCQTGGCPFAWNDTTTSFASRFRGFLNVTPELAGIPVHIGFYADDAVSLTFYDKSHNAFPVLTQPPVLGSPTWRVTETVTFMQTGLYPLEILYAQIVEHAALEMSFFTATFCDIDYPANLVPTAGMCPNPSLNTTGFTLFPVTRFFQTLSGQPSYPNIDQCKQCDRQFVGQLGNNGCDMGYYCNEAALCAPCDSAIYCGPSCSPCGGMTPFCININAQMQCGQCRTDTDCKQGFSCDPVTHVCNQCNVDADCTRGHECVAHVCKWCAETDKCAGNSCNCCPIGNNGKQMQCALTPAEQGMSGMGAPDGGAAAEGPPPECVECLTNTDCTEGGVCDPNIGQCVPQMNPHESPDCCGPNCLNCNTPTPTCHVDGDPCMQGADCCSTNCVTLQGVSTCQPMLCLPGPYGTACADCRNDMECSDGSYCREGNCSTCNVDRRCGTRCESCGGDTPFCNGATLAKDAACVRCTQDAQCAGGTCDMGTSTCTSSCQMSCAPATPFCDGTDCVECYADTQCPCGNTCNLDTHTCSTSCKDNGDCLGDQHCHYTPDGNSKMCSPGPLPDNADCGGTLADLCGGSIGARGSHPTPSPGILALSLMALLLRRLRTRREATR